MPTDEPSVPDRPEDSAASPLTRRERTVNDAIAEESPVHAAAYRRLVELAATVEIDPAGIVLVGHLARELMNSLPRVSGRLSRAPRVDYIAPLDRITALWPRDSAGERGDIPTEAFFELKALADVHDQSRSRRSEAAEFIVERDPAHRATVPDLGIRQWSRLHGRATDLAHALMRGRSVQDVKAEEARAVADELTATLHSIYAPFYESMDVIDEVLAGQEIAAESVATLLRTAAQLAHFFSHADARWLDPLDAAGFFRHPPGLEDAGGGYVRTPQWPEGEYLARLAPDLPLRVAQIAARVPASDNPRVGRTIIEIALALPPAQAKTLVPMIARALSSSLATLLMTTEALRLVERLVEPGETAAALDLFAAILDGALIQAAAGQDWDLDQTLGDTFDRLIVADARRLAGIIQDRLDRGLAQAGQAARYSGMWLPRVDRIPRFGRDGLGRLANALYRTLIGSSEAAANGASTRFAQVEQPVLVRIGLAVTSDHPGRIGPLDTLLADPRRWERTDARFEFRRVVRLRLQDASEASLLAVLEYAQAAEEAHALIDRLGVADAVEREFQVRRWRTQLLGATWNAVPSEWQERLGPLVEGEPTEEDIPDVEARFVQETRHTVEELAGLAPSDLLALVHDWAPSAEHPYESRAGLTSLAADVIVGDLEHHLHLLAAYGDEPSSVVGEIARRLSSGVEDHPELSLTSLEPFLRQTLVRRDSDVPEGFADAVRWVAGLVDKLALHDRLGGPSAPLTWLTTALHDLLTGPLLGNDQITDAEWRPVEMALNDPDGLVIQAAARVARRFHETPDCDEATLLVLEALRAAVPLRLSIADRAAYGLALPLILAAAPDDISGWVETLLGDDVPNPQWSAAFDAYLFGWHFNSWTAKHLIGAYRRRVSELIPATDAENDLPTPEALGAHLLLLDVADIGDGRSGGWLRRWYSSAQESARSFVTRLTTDIASKSPAEGERARAKALLKERIALYPSETSARELRAISWISSTEHEPGMVLETIVLPGLQASSGGADDGPGLVKMIADEAAGVPEAAVEALKLLIDGDEYGVLSSLAEGDLRRALGNLLDIPSTSRRASRLVHDLGARGFRQYEDLLADRNG